LFVCLFFFFLVVFFSQFDLSFLSAKPSFTPKGV
jgi:hypothetical protein